MAVQINYMLKVNDAKLGVIKKALKAADIDVVSLIEVFKQERDAPPADEAPSQS